MYSLASPSAGLDSPGAPAWFGSGGSLRLENAAPGGGGDASICGSDARRLGETTRPSRPASSASNCRIDSGMLGEMNRSLGIRSFASFEAGKLELRAWDSRRGGGGGGGDGGCASGSSAVTVTSLSILPCSTGFLGRIDTLACVGNVGSLKLKELLRRKDSPVNICSGRGGDGRRDLISGSAKYTSSMVGWH